MGLFDFLKKPKWKDENWRVRLEAVREMTDQKTLAKIAKEDRVADVSRGAVKKITDDEILVDVANNSSDTFGAAVMAIDMIKDESCLIKVAKNASYIGNRKHAISRITNLDVLKDFAENDPSKDIRSEAQSYWEYNRKKQIRSIEIEDELIDIAKNDPDRGARETAVSKITNQDVLVDIAKNDSDVFVRERAVMKITDQDILADFARNDSAFVSAAATNALTDKSVVIDVIRNKGSNNLFLEHLALYNFDDDILAEVMKMAHVEKTFMKAFENVSDYDNPQVQSVFAYVARGNSDTNIRKRVIRLLNDRDVLNDIARNDFYSTSVTRTRRGKMIGFSDHDGPEYEYIKTTETVYPIREIAKERLERLNDN